jgi:hypothetical protein
MKASGTLGTRSERKWAIQLVQLRVFFTYPAVCEAVADSFQLSAKPYGSKASSQSVGVCKASTSVVRVDKCRGKHKGLWIVIEVNHVTAPYVGVDMT